MTEVQTIDNVSLHPLKHHQKPHIKESMRKSQIRYRENNREKLNEKQRKKYTENKEKIKQRRKEVIECECGRSIRRGSIYTHRKTKIHELYLKIKELEN